MIYATQCLVNSKKSIGKSSRKFVSVVAFEQAIKNTNKRGLRILVLIRGEKP